MLNQNKKIFMEVCNMAVVNLYRIDKEKEELFIQDLARKMELTETIIRERQLIEGEIEYIELSLYLPRPVNDKELTWNWVLKEFNQTSIRRKKMPSSIVVIKKGKVLFM